MRKYTWMTLALLLAVPAIGGCVGEGDKSILSGSYWERHFDKINSDVHGFRIDLDRALFRIEDEPVELSD